MKRLIGATLIVSSKASATLAAVAESPETEGGNGRVFIKCKSKAFGAAVVTAALFTTTAVVSLAQSQQIPLYQLGAAATKQFKADSLSIAATQDGARLNCAMQRLEAEATPQGLWLASTPEAVLGEQFRVVAVSVGRTESEPLSLAATGKVMLTDQLVRFIRRSLREEYSVSMDGVQQDFVITQRPPGMGELCVELALKNAAAEATAYGVKLTLSASGRKLAYSRLWATDAAGQTLSARMEVRSADRILVRADDAEAVYPIRIDPTFSDANWITMDGFGAVNNKVYAVVMDDAANLYVGGSFTAVGSVAASRIAKWNGTSWSALGSGMNANVSALAVSGSDLYAGGYFTTAGGVPATFIAKWDGSSWSAVGSGVNAYVYALAVSGTNLYAGGQFTGASGVPAIRVARWNGSSWSALGSGMNGAVWELAVSGSGALYAGGEFTAAGGAPADRVAKWDGSNWSALGSGMNDTVIAVAVAGSGDLYAGGYFTTADGVSANRVAKWSGSSWSALGSGMNNAVLALAVAGSDVYAGGYFTAAGGVPAACIAKWDGSSWSPLGSGMGKYVHALAVAGSDLYAGGEFTSAGGKPSERVARAVLGDAPGCNQLSGTLLPEGAMELSYIGYPATNYALDRAFTVASPTSWVGQQTNTMTVSGVLMFTNATAPNTNNFWRIRSVP